jgi:hypothetical protein
MSGMRPDRYGRIAERARTQLGLITVEQLDDLGITRHQRAGMVRSGAWERRGRRVLADSAAPRTIEQELLARVLDAGRAAAVTRASAAWLRGLSGFDPVPADVLVKRGGNHRPTAGAVLHETFWFPSRHVHVVRGVPCVTDARLAFELAAIVHPKRLRRIVDWLHTNRGMEYGQMSLVAAELWRRGKPGSAEMRLVVDERSPGYVPPASELEACYSDFCEDFGLPPGVRQVPLGGDRLVGRVDVVYPEHKLVVELDSRRWHDTSTAFEDDRVRDNSLVAAGWRVIRITWRMLHDDPARVAALLRRLLASCGDPAA